MPGEPLTIFRPVFYLITFMLISNFAFIIFLRNKVSAVAYILFNSFLLVVSSGVMLFTLGIAVDEFSRSGDGLVFYLTLLAGVIFLGSFLYKVRKEI